MEANPAPPIKKEPILIDAWQRLAEYDHNANQTSKRFGKLRKQILYLGVISTTLALVYELYLSEILIPIPFFDPEKFSINHIARIIVVLLPITISALLTWANKFERGVSWILLRGSAEAIKFEIYKYRTSTDVYDPARCVHESRELKLANRIRSIGERLMKTEVNQVGLEEYQGDLPPMYASADGDDGFSLLSPDDYIKFRLEDQLFYYKRKSAEIGDRVRQLQFLIILFGAIGTFLAAIEYEAWIAVTTAIVAAYTSYLEYNQYETTLTAYNQAASDLESLRLWWRAVPIAKKDSQEFFNKLVSGTEQILQTEQSNWAQNMKDALAELAEEDKETLENIEIKKLSELKIPSPEYTYDGADLSVFGVEKEELELSEEDIAALKAMGIDIHYEAAEGNGHGSIKKASAGAETKAKSEKPKEKEKDSDKIRLDDFLGGDDDEEEDDDDLDLDGLFDLDDEDDDEPQEMDQDDILDQLSADQLASAGLEIVEDED